MNGLEGSVYDERGISGVVISRVIWYYIAEKVFHMSLEVFKIYCYRCGAENENNCKFRKECGDLIEVTVVANVKRSPKEEMAYYKANLRMQHEALKLQQQQLIEHQKQFSYGKMSALQFEFII